MISLDKGRPTFAFPDFEKSFSLIFNVSIYTIINSFFIFNMKFISIFLLILNFVNPISSNDLKIHEPIILVHEGFGEPPIIRHNDIDIWKGGVLIHQHNETNPLGTSNINMQQLIHDIRRFKRNTGHIASVHQKFNRKGRPKTGFSQMKLIKKKHPCLPSQSFPYKSRKAFNTDLVRKRLIKRQSFVNPINDYDYFNDDDNDLSILHNDTIKKYNEPELVDIADIRKSFKNSTKSGTGRCVVSADLSSHYCGSVEVSTPPIIPENAGKCIISQKSGREICYPSYTELDTTCTDYNEYPNSVVQPINVPHATVRVLAYFPLSNLQRLIKQYYRQQGKQMPKNLKLGSSYSGKDSFLYAKYECNEGYEMIDEVDVMFCYNRQWVRTPPVCRGLGGCAEDNGGCSHNCRSLPDNNVECSCSKGMVLDQTGKICIIPVPEVFCRKLANCHCIPIDSTQYSCDCPNRENCLLRKEAPKIYLEPSGPYEVKPGGSINITCYGVGFDYPKLSWHQVGEENSNIKPISGTIKTQQMLEIKNLYKTTDFICSAENDMGIASKQITITVMGPGFAPIIKKISPSRKSITINWDKPIYTSNPITTYTIYYTDKGKKPLKDWQSIEVNEPNHSVTIPNLKPNTKYHIKMRANDVLGPGKIGNPVAINTLKPAKKPEIKIVEGDNISVKPLEPFVITCNVTKSDPTPEIVWINKGRPVNKKQKYITSVLHHAGLYEETSFTCEAENEAGKTQKTVYVYVTGPLKPEKIKGKVKGNNIDVAWKPPLITNGPMKDYEILYTDDPSLPEDKWEKINVGSPDINSFTIPNLKEMTPYTIKMRGINDKGEGVISEPIEITTWLAPRIPKVTLTPSEDIEKKPSNDDMEYICLANGVPKPKIVWYWNDEPIEDGKNDFRIYDISTPDDNEESKSKLISEVTTKSGQVKCHAVNNVGEDEMINNVKILGPGSAPLSITPTPNENGFDVTWKPPSLPNGKITNYILYYTKNPDDDLGDWKQVFIKGDKDNIKVIDQDEDTNYYVKMQAVNEDGPGLISEAFEVTTGQKHIPLSVSLKLIDPESYEDEGIPITVDPNQTIKFKCYAEGRPTPIVTYSWLSTNNETDSGSQPEPVRIEPVEGNPHTYVSVEISTYTQTKRVLICQARNPDGSQVSRQVVDVNKPGSPPQNIEVELANDNSATISWKDPRYPNGDLTGYKLYLTPDPSLPLDQWQVIEISDPISNEKNFARGELEPSTKYYVKISAFNKNGEGVISDTEQFETGTGAPLDAPYDILSNVKEDNTLDLSWTGPKFPNGPIEGYNIYFVPENVVSEDSDYKDWTKINVPSHEDHGSITIDKGQYLFAPNTTYLVRISAINDLNEGPASDVVKFETGTGETAPVITLNPPYERIEVPPMGSVIVECTATGIYKPTVQWLDKDGNKVSDRVLQVSNIIKDESYICIAENNVGKVQKILQISVTGPGTPPNEIVGLPIGDKVANIEWATPDVPNGAITGYVVEYAEIGPDGHTPTEWKTINITGPMEQIKLDNLKPKTDYAVKVQAISNRGPGVISEPIRIKTLPTAPEKPETPEVIVHGNNTIEVKLPKVKDPQNPDNLINDYVIKYTKDHPPTDDADWKELTYTAPDKDENLVIPIYGENVDPETKYHLKVIPRGEIDGPPSDIVSFETGDGIVPPSIPKLDVTTDEDGVIKLPPGSDYKVRCTSTGHPEPKILWVDEFGNTLSVGEFYSIEDIKSSKKFKCIARNQGGEEEKLLDIHVMGPGTAPEDIKLSSFRPRTIDVSFMPPEITNGNITMYIVYYTPLDDQDPTKEIGQVPSKPIRDWQTYHVTGDNLNEGEQNAKLTGVDPDTSYAVVVQAGNNDGPGPFSSTQTIRTISRARESAPDQLKVVPFSPYSADVEWKNPESMEEEPIGYELFFVPADKKVESEDDRLLDDWEKMTIDGVETTTKIEDLLKPDTEYVFKIRAIFPDGPGVFSKACISRTLPLGNPPYITTSHGGHGTDGKTTVYLLPGSSYTVFCNATGDPQPEVKWIRGGEHAIDPSTVKANKEHAEWSLRVYNVTTNAEFVCVAQNSLGTAQWTIDIEVLPQQSPDWQTKFVKPVFEDGTVKLKFTDELPEYLKNANEWIVLYSDDNTRPVEEWDSISGKGPLESVTIPEMNEGKVYFVVVDNPERGIQTPTFSILTPKPPSDIRVGTNINDETVVSFKPAIAGDISIKEYEIKAVNKEDPSEIYFQTIPSGSDTNVVIDSILPGTEYTFTIRAKLENGEVLESVPLDSRTSPAGIDCNCKENQVCQLISDDNDAVKTVCYCIEGFKMSKDGVTCETTEEYSSSHQDINVTQEPPTTESPIEVENIEGNEKDLSVYPESDKEEEKTRTDQNIVKIHETDGDKPSLGEKPKEEVPKIPIEKIEEYEDEEGTSVRPTDIYGKEVYEIIGPDGKPLPTSSTGRYVNKLGEEIDLDSENRPLDPEGNLLPTRSTGQFVYPATDSQNNILPTDTSGIPVYPVVDSDGQLYPTSSSTGARVDQSGKPIPTNMYGEPQSETGQTLPINEKGIHIYEIIEPEEQLHSTDSYGKIVYPITSPDGTPLQKNDEGRYIDKDGNEIPVNDEGKPIDEENNVLPTTDKGVYIYPPISEDKILIQEPKKDDDDEISEETLSPSIKDDTKLVEKDQECANLLKDSSLFFIFETSRASEPIFEKFRTILVDFFINKLDIRQEKIGLANYGNAVEILYDIGNYEDTEEIKETLMELHFTGGIADPLLALKSVLDILHESNEQSEKVMILFTMTDITGPVKEKFDSLARLEELRVVIINMQDFVHDRNQNVKLLQKICSSLKDKIKQVTLFTPIYKDFITTTISSYTTSVTIQQPEEIKTTEEKVKSCSLNHAKIDIVFAIADNVMDVGDYKIVINSISDLIKKDLDMAPDVTRVSVINYGKSASIPVSLGGYQEKGEINYILKKTKQSPNLERPEINTLINAAHQQFATFSNRETSKIIVTFTNGEDINRYPYNMDRLPYPVLVITLDEFIEEVKDKKTKAYFIEEWNQLSSEVIKNFIENECKAKFIDYPYAISKIKTLPTVLPKDKTTVPKKEFEAEGQTLPYDDDETNNVLPTDIYGKIIYKIVDIDGKPLPTSSTGRHINKLGEEIDLDSEDHPLDPLGKILPQKPSGEYVYPETDERGNILPVDIYGRPVYPITDENGQLYPTSPSTKARIDHEGKPIPTSYKTGRPISLSGHQLPKDETGNYIYQMPESEEIYTTNVYGKTVYPITYPDGTPLEKNEDGDYITKDGDIIKTDENGIPIGPDNQLLKKDDKGNYIYTFDGKEETTESPDMVFKIVPTDIYGEKVYEIIGPDGKPLPTSTTGKHINKLEEEIQLDSRRRPIGPDGQVLPTDDEGKYVYPATDSQNNILPTDRSGIPVYPIVDSDGQLYPTSRTTGARVDESGKPIPTSSKTGIPVSETGQPLPTDESGMFIHETSATKDVVPTNIYGKKVYPIVDEDGVLLPKNRNGDFVDKDGNVIRTNKEGIPIGPDNQLLDKDDRGNYVYKPEVSPDMVGKTLPTDAYGEEVHEIIGPDGEPLPTSSTGRYINKLGEEIPTDSSKRPIGPDGQVLPTDDEGKYVYPATDSQNNILPTDTSRIPVYPIVDSDGQLYPTSRTTGARVDESGKPIPTSSKTGIPVSETGQPLPTDESGMFIYETSATKDVVPTNIYGKKVYPIVDEDGVLLPRNRNGDFVDKDGNVIRTNEDGIPIGPDNQLLDKDDRGNYIFHKAKYYETTPPTFVEGHSLPTDKDEIYEDDQTVLPTDIYGRTIYEIVELDGKPLPTSTTGRYINKLGEEIQLDSQDRPLDPEGNVLPTRSTGQFVYPATDSEDKILPTDKSGVPVYPIVNADGQLYPTSESTGARIDESGKPIPTVAITGIPVSESGQALPTEDTGVFVYETPTNGEVFTTNVYGKIVYPIVNEEGMLLKKNDDGDFVDENGDIIRTNEEGIPIGPDNQLLDKDDKGNYVYKPEVSPDMSGKTLPTDVYGEEVHEIIGPDGKPLPTSSTGRYIDKLGEEIPTDSSKRPIGPDGQVLPIDDEGKYVYPATDSQNNILPTDTSGIPVYPIVDSDGQLYPTSRTTGARVDESGKPIPTSSKTGIPVSETGQPLPTDESGMFIHETSATKDVVPTNIYGKKVYPIVDEDGVLLPRNRNGDFVDKDGNVIRTNEEGIPIGPDNQLLDKDDKGNYVYKPEVSPDMAGKTLPTDVYGEEVHEIIGPDGKPLPTSSTGRYIDKLGEEIPTDSSKRPIGPDGQVLPTDDEGKYVYPATDSQNNILPTDRSGIPVYPIVDSDGQLYPTSRTTGARVDESGKPIPTSSKTGIPVSETGQPLPTDESGMFIYETSATKDVVPTNIYGKKVYPIVDEDGVLLSKNRNGDFVDKDGNVIRTNEDGIPIGPDNQLLDKDDRGNYIFHKAKYYETTPPTFVEGHSLPTDKDEIYEDDQTVLPTDIYGRTIYEIVELDGKPLPTSTTGRHINKLGEEIQLDSQDRPLDPEGNVLPTRSTGQFVYPATDSEDKILPTDTSGVPVYPIVNADGQLYPTSRTTGARIDESGKPIPTVAITGIPVSESGQALPTEEPGVFVYETPTSGEVFTTNVYGKIVYPIVNEEGMLLNKNDDGDFVDENGDIIRTNEEGIPIGPDNQLLDKDDKGNYVYKPEVSPDMAGKTLPTDVYGEEVHEIIGPDGKPLPTSSTGRYINKLGEEIPTDSSKRPIGPDGQVLPIDDEGKYVYPATDSQNNILPTDTSGIPVYPIVDSDGQLYPTSRTTGARVDESGKPIPTSSKTGIPVSETGQPLPTDESGMFIHETSATKDVVPTNIYGKKVYPIVDEDGVLLPKNRNGDFVDKDGNVIRTNEDGIPIGPDNQLLDKDDKGNYVYKPEVSPDMAGKTLPIDVYGEEVHEIIGPDGKPLPTSSTGRYIDKLGEEIPTDSSKRPIGPDGQVLPTDDEGKYVYPATDSQNNILPTDTSGIPVYPIVDSDGQLYPTSRTTGARVDESGKPIPTSSKTGIPVSETGQPLPTDESGMFIHETSATKDVVPTNTYGKKVYPIVDEDGVLLPRNRNGDFVDKDGNVIRTNEDGIPIGPDNQLLDKDDKGNYVYKPEVSPDMAGKTLPTDAYGEEVHEIIGPDGKPLPTSSTGRYINKLGEEIPTDSSKRPIGPDGQVLPTDDEGKYVYPATDSQNNILPTDRSGIPVYPIVDSDGQLYPTSRTTGARVDESGKPIPTSSKTGIPVSETGQPLPTDESGMFIHETSATKDVVPTNIYGKKVYPIVDEDGVLLPKNRNGDFVDKDGNVIRTNEDGIPIGPDNQLLDKDDRGNYIFHKAKYYETTPPTFVEGHSLPTDKDEIYEDDQTVLPTDIYGRTIYEIVELDGKPLPTSTTGRYINKLGEEIQLDSQDRPLDPEGNVLPTRSTGQFVYPATDSEDKILPIDTSGVPVYPIVNADGQLYPTSESTGARIDESGKPIPTVAITGIPVSESGQALPTEDTGVFVYETPTNGEVFTTNVYGKIVYPIVNEEGMLLKKNDDGDFVDENGDIIRTNEEGIPIGPDNQLLDKDDRGNYVYKPEVSPDMAGKTLPTDVYGEEVHEIIGPDGKPLPTSSTGRYIDKLGEEIPTDSSKRPIGPDGQVLPTDDEGKYVYPATDSQNNILPTDRSGIPVYPIVDSDGQLYPTSRTTGARVDESGKPIPTSSKTGIPVSETGQPLPTDESGMFIHETSATKDVVPTNIYGKKVYPIVDEDGVLLPRNRNGDFVDKDGNIIRTNEDGIPIGPDNQLLDKDDRGNYVYKTEIVSHHTESPYLVGQTLPTDIYGDTIYEIIGPDGQILPTSSTGRHINKLGEEIPLDAEDRPLGPDGKILPTTNTNQYIYPATDSQNNILPTDRSGIPVYPIVDSDGQLYPTSRTSGARVDELGKPIPTSSKTGIPVSETGQPLPTDESGVYVYEKDEQTVLPTDVYGRTIFEIVDLDGKPLPTSTTGRYINKLGEEIQLDSQDRPLDPEGNVLPTRGTDQFVYPATDKDNNVLPTDTSGVPIYPIVNADGQLYPTSRTTGARIDETGKPIPTVAITGIPISESGHTLPTEEPGVFIYETPTSGEALTTNAYGKIVYPIVNEEGNFLPKNDDGEYVDEKGDTIRTTDDDIPLGPDGIPLKQDNKGNYIYVPISLESTTKQPIIITSPLGEPLEKDENGNYINSNGEIIKFNDEMKPLDPNDDVLPTSESGSYIYPYVDESGQILPTDVSRRPIYKIVDFEGKPLSQDSNGRYIDDENKPIPTSSTGIPLKKTGEPLNKDKFGNFIYDSSLSGDILPTDKSLQIVDHLGEPLKKDDTGTVFIDPKGTPINTDDQGRPLSPDGSVLPTNSLGQYYIEEVKDSTLKPTDDSLLSKDYNILSYDNTPLKKDSKTEQFFNPIGQLIPINDKFEPLDPNGNVLKKNEDGIYIYPAIDPNGKILELSDNGIPIYPVTDIHGDIMPTTSDKLYTDHGGNIIPTSETGIPLGINGLPLPVSDKGYHVMIGPVNRTSSHCYVDSYINLLIIYDASNDIKVLDYRLLKELAKNFLVEHFNLNINRVRVGLLKYGEDAEVTLSFGDYDNEAQLLLKLGEARRLKGENNLYNALNQAIGEFIIEQNEKVPHVAIIFKNGKSSSDITIPAKQLRENTKTNIYVVSNNGDEKEDLALVGEGNNRRIVNVNGWKNTKPTDLGIIADDICKYSPKVSKDEDIPWPTRKPSYTIAPIFSKQKICDKIDFGLDFIIVLDASDNVDKNTYEKIKDGLGTFIDEYLDMSPDVVRVGFIQYSDKVNVPISLGHYQDKEEILLTLKDLEKESGIPIALKGFDAARVQLAEHGRKDIPNVILLVTTGKNRGNTIGAAYDLRETYGSQIFALAINPDVDQLNSLRRIVGKEYAHERLLTIDNADELYGKGLNKISKALCGNIVLKDETDYTLKSQTTKRSTDDKINENNIVTKTPSIRTTRSLKPVPLCKDGIIRPFFFSLVIDTTSRSEEKDFKNTLKSLINFFNSKFEATPMMAVTNIITVDSNGITNRKLGLDVESLSQELSKITQSSNDFSSPKLGLAIDEATMEAAKNAISGTTKIMLVISSDGTSNDDPLPSAEFATDDFLHNIISISLRNPSSDLLTKISGNSPTRVIHLSEWENIEELFNSWTSFAICETINTKDQDKIKDKKKMISKENNKIVKNKEDMPSRISVVGVTPNSLSVSWICCTNDKQKYTIKYSPDVTIPLKNWPSLNASCKDGFGKEITDLPTDNNYYVCVFTNDKIKNADTKYNSENCDFVHLDQNTNAPDDFEHTLNNTIPDKCKCRCDNEGEVVAPSPCDIQQYDTFSPINTLPPHMENNDCPCRIKSHRGKCPTGYYYNRGQCYDVNECLQQNGGCSHGCVNTPGDFYCACPHGMTRDPANPKKCISINSSFDRITEMLAQYLHGNAQFATNNKLMNQNGGIDKTKPIKYKTIIESEDKSKKITFEWSQMPSMVKKALKWLL
uniref:Uncharacterized protein n=1 Tax=Strongyloides stercoralis TaxID=6248 RepID=A0AAF5I0P7_STRER